MEKQKKKKPALPAPRKKRRSKKKEKEQRRLSALGKQSLQSLFSRNSLHEVDMDELITRAGTPKSSALPGHISVKSPPAIKVPSRTQYIKLVAQQKNGGSPPALPFRPLPPIPGERGGNEIIRIKSVTSSDHKKNLPPRPSRPKVAKSLNEALEGIRRYRESGRIPNMRNYDSDDDEEDELPTPLTRMEGAGRESAADPILKMAAKLCRNDIHVTYLQVKTKLVTAFGRARFQEKKKEVVRLLRWRKETVEYDTQTQDDRDVALDAVWGSGTSLIDPVIDPEDAHGGGVEVEGLPTNAPLSHSFNYLQRQVLGHPFVLIRVIRARGLMSKGARSVVKASNPSCT
jgi:hypothetical protein